MQKNIRLLIVEDSEDDAFLLQRHLQKQGFDLACLRVDTRSSMIAALTEQTWDAVISDYSMPQFSGLAALHALKEKNMDLPFIIVSRAMGEETAVELMRAGVNDYIMKNNLARLGPALERELREAERRKRERDKQFHLEEQLRNAVSDGLVILDRMGQILKVNSAACAILQIPYGNSVQRTLPVVTQSWQEELAGDIQSAQKSGLVRHRNRVQDTTTETERTYSYTVTPLQGDMEESVIVVIQDSSRLHVLEKEVFERNSFQNIVGKSPVMQRVFEMIRLLSNTDTTVLVQGPSGTGKELICAALHYHGCRSQGPYVKVNCAALPETLLESELFGHIKGSFTGATKDKIGRFEAADKGTLFLDEIGDISPALQVRLLRVLQEKEIERVGTNKPIPVDVRVVTATNQNLWERVKEGKFREDLFYRLNVVSIDMPPLKNRKEDIPLLTQHFLRSFEAHFNKPLLGIEPQAMNALLRCDWPGNVRQLENALERAFVLSPNGMILAENLPSEVLQFSLDTILPPHSDMPITIGPHDESLHDIQHLKDVLASVGWNRSKAAALLGVHRNTITHWIRQYNLVVRD